MLTSSLVCLVLAIYYEARSEPVAGQYAVAEVVLNRVASPRFPDSVCEVVTQDLGPNPHDCQFSFYCDGKPEVMRNTTAMKQALAIATAVMDDPTVVANGALFYHADYVSPKWSKKMTPTVMVGAHIFFTDEVDGT